MYLGHFDLTRPLLWTVDDVLSPSACAGLIARGDRAEWLAATVNSGKGRVVDERLRDNELILVEDDALTQTLEARLRPHLPETIKGHELFGIGPKMRIYRYLPGMHFGLHHDQHYRGPAQGGRGLLSQLTLLVYLDADFVGGETRFPEQDEVIVPATGRALLFQHMLLHEGARVVSGVKHVLRTDVFYYDD